MSRHYATMEDTGERFLHHISCDHSGCAETIKPHPEIADSGWTKHGKKEHDTRFEWNYCQEHS